MRVSSSHGQFISYNFLHSEKLLVPDLLDNQDESSRRSSRAASEVLSKKRDRRSISHDSIRNLARVSPKDEHHSSRGKRGKSPLPR